MAKKYDKESINVIIDDILRIRQRWSMYGGYRGKDGIIHVMKEVLQNSIDEMIEILRLKAEGEYDGVLPTEIFIDYDQKRNVITIEDQGRGIPIEMVVKVATIQNSSGKFKKGKNSAYRFASGENGVGLTLANATADYMKITVCRDGKKYQAVFESGRVVKDGIIGKSNKTGTKVEFQPAGEMFENATLDADDVLNFCKEMAFLVPVKFKVHVSALGKDGDINKTFHCKDGIMDCLMELIKKETLLVPPMKFTAEAEDKIIEIAMAYTANGKPERVKSYANFCTTVDHGTPLIGCKKGLTRVLVKYIKENCLNKKELESLNIDGDDCRSGWVCVINVLHEEAHFIGQMKAKIDNKDLVSFAESTMVKGLTSWIQNNEKVAKKLGTVIKNLAKHRQEGAKIRQTQIVKEINIFNINPAKYKRANDKQEELYIVEGASAAGPSDKARDKAFQEVYAMRGVPLNSYGMNYLKVKENEEFKELASIIGTDLGPKFNIKKCRYKRIIIGTDADVDGNRITSLLSVFFLCHMPGIVEAGMLYKVVPPLYKLHNKKINNSEYVENKAQFNEFIQKEIAKTNTIKINGKKLSSKEIIKILNDNKGYLRALSKASNKNAVHPDIIEIILANRGLSTTKLQKVIKKNSKYIETSVVKGKLIVEGIFDKEFQYAVIDEHLFDKTKELISYIDACKEKYGTIEFDVNGDKYSLGQMLKYFKKYEPKVTRFKGLGEMSADQFGKTIMDVENRNLLRLTTDDLKRDVERFAVLHSTKEKDRLKRAEMFSTFKIDIEDIDN